MVRSQKRGIVQAIMSGVLWATYSVTLYSWLSPYNVDTGSLDSAKGVMFIILAAIGIAWIDALITGIYEIGWVVIQKKWDLFVKMLRSSAFF